MRCVKPLKIIPKTFYCTLLLVTALSGCASPNASKAVHQSRSAYFPEGVVINGEKWEGAFYVLSAEAYTEMFFR